MNVNLTEYLSSLPRGGKSRFAKSLNVSKSFLRQMETGKSQIPIGVARKIENETSGIVKKEVLRPDVWE